MTTNRFTNVAIKNGRYTETKIEETITVDLEIKSPTIDAKVIAAGAYGQIKVQIDGDTFVGHNPFLRSGEDRLPQVLVNERKTFAVYTTNISFDLPEKMMARLHNDYICHSGDRYWLPVSEILEIYKDAVL